MILPIIRISNKINYTVIQNYTIVVSYKHIMCDILYNSIFTITNQM